MFHFLRFSLKNLKQNSSINSYIPLVVGTWRLLTLFLYFRYFCYVLFLNVSKQPQIILEVNKTKTCWKYTLFWWCGEGHSPSVSLSKRQPPKGPHVLHIFPRLSCVVHATQMLSKNFLTIWNLNNWDSPSACRSRSSG